MEENIVGQVRSIEAEADRIVAEANERAGQLAEALNSETATHQQEHESSLRGRIATLKQELDRETAERLAEIEANAKKATQQLESLDTQVVERALESILSRLRGKDACQ
jgi:phenylalanyl-tRNA synthetase alpha subunit